jgi:hypothetical protein
MTTSSETVSQFSMMASFELEVANSLVKSSRDSQ